MKDLRLTPDTLNLAEEKVGSVLELTGIGKINKKWRKEGTKEHFKVHKELKKLKIMEASKSIENWITGQTEKYQNI